MTNATESPWRARASGSESVEKAIAMGVAVR